MHHIPECTVQLRDGRFCYAPSMDDAPFPICERHAKKLITHLGVDLNSLYTEAEKIELLKDRPTPEQRELDRKRAYATQSVVYYVQLGDHIKIGYSTNMTLRLAAFRVDPDVVLATEPGGAKLEKIRHRQFKHLRRGKREDFEIADDLMQHIATVRDRYGLPSITGYLNADAVDRITSEVAAHVA